jgi:hypothetical protein
MSPHANGDDPEEGRAGLSVAASVEAVPDRLAAGCRELASLTSAFQALAGAHRPTFLAI